jgi:hypothetical protein
MLLALLSDAATAACAPIQVGYLDQHRPPYWLGVGKAVPEAPGASVELIRQFTASAGCPARLVRMPVLRIKPTLAAGEIDFAPVASTAEGSPGIVFPLDKQRHLDQARSMPLVVVVFVRASDGLGRKINPGQYFQGRTLGTTLGSSYAEKMRRAGIGVDSGAVDVAGNFEKLKLRRFDGFAVSLISADDMDALVTRKYGGDIVRLTEPLFSDNIWLAASQSYYDRHPRRVEAMWDWLGSSGKKELSKLLAKYYDQD